MVEQPERNGRTADLTTVLSRRRFPWSALKRLALLFTFRSCFFTLYIFCVADFGIFPFFFELVSGPGIRKGNYSRRHNFMTGHEDDENMTNPFLACCARRLGLGGWGAGGLGVGVGGRSWSASGQMCFKIR